jgi:hypothetical protein
MDDVKILFLPYKYIVNRSSSSSSSSLNVVCDAVVVEQIADSRKKTVHIMFRGIVHSRVKSNYIKT